MKRVYISLGVLVLCFLIMIISGTFTQFGTYSDHRAEISRNSDEISSINQEIAQLNHELDLLRGPNVPRNLRQIMGYLQRFDGVTVNSIRAFEISGDSLHFVKNITNINDPELYEGYEISLTVSELISFMEYFDQSNISYVSIDLLFGSDTVVFRVRTGGVA